jgi:hypothetical protein
MEPQKKLPDFLEQTQLSYFDPEQTHQLELELAKQKTTKQ